MTLPARFFSPVVWILLPVGALISIGLCSIWTAAPVEVPAGEGMHEAAKAVLKSFFGKQCAAAAIGIAAAFFISRVRPMRLRAAGYGLYGACLGVLLVLFVLGRVRNGARSWFVLGPVSIQPSEFMKLFFILTLARFLMWRPAPDTLRRLVAPAAIVFVPFAIILLQPDLGTALIFPSMFVAMIWTAGARKRHLIAGLLLTAIAVPLAYKFAFKDYQKKRFQAFLNPQAMSQDAGFQLLQSQKAIGSGGWVGRGWGESDQDGGGSFVPERHNDFIFSVIGEEWGFLGSSAVLALYLMLLTAMVFAAFRQREPFGRYVLAGLSAGFATQIFVNVGMTIGMAPITGITLPFLSYGGSSLLASMLGVGVVWNLVGRQVVTLAGKDFVENADEVQDLGVHSLAKSA